MGGLGRLIPFTAAMMLIGNLALTGFPFTAGFFSKDAIIESAYASKTPGHDYAFLLLVLAAFMTSFYSWRLYFMTFMGASRASALTLSKVHESPRTMLIPLGVLAAGSILAGFPFAEKFIGHDFGKFWKQALFSADNNAILDHIHHVPLWVKLSPFIMMAAGLALAWQMYIRRPELPGQLAERFQPVYQFLLNKWYFDELYDRLLVKPCMALGRLLWKRGDGWLIDGFGPDGVSARVLQVAGRAVKLQTGYVYHYAFAMLLGVAALVTWTMFGGAR